MTTIQSSLVALTIVQVLFAVDEIVNNGSRRMGVVIYCLLAGSMAFATLQNF